MTDEQEQEPLAFPNFKPVSMEMTFANVDPGVWELLTGGAFADSKPATHSMEVYGEHPWKWWQWQWWLQRTPWRRPKRQYHYYFPNVKIETPEVSRNQKASE